jgi:hypothetical protein
VKPMRGNSSTHGFKSLTKEKIKPMKNQKVTIVGIVSIAIIAFALQVQRAVSQSGLPSSSQSFNSHYTEFDASLSAGQTSATTGLPVLNRTVRLSYSYNTAAGDFTFGEMILYYRTGVNEFWTFNGGPVFPGEPYSLGGLLWHIGTNGTFYFQDDSGTNGDLHIGMWY